MNSNEQKLRDMAMRVKSIQDALPHADPSQQEQFADQAMPLLEELEKILTEIVAIQEKEQNMAQPNVPPAATHKS